MIMMMMMMMMMSQVGQAPAARLSGLVMRDLPNGTVLSYEGVEREVELLGETHDILLSNLTCADSGVYSCQLSAPVGQQNRDGEIHLILTGKRHSSGHSVVGLSSELSQFPHGKHLTYKWNTHRQRLLIWTSRLWPGSADVCLRCGCSRVNHLWSSGLVFICSAKLILTWGFLWFLLKLISQDFLLVLTEVASSHLILTPSKCARAAETLRQDVLS